VNSVSWTRMTAAFVLTSFALSASAGTGTASRPAAAFGAELDHLIPQAQWEAAGLNKLGLSEQNALAGEIAGLVAAAQAPTDASPQNDRTQWRKLHRHMSQGDVKNLLGEPNRVSVSRFYVEWDYPRGTVVFDSKGRLDSWSEL
jgi:hypothetical protein